MSLIHNTIKCKFVDEGWLPNYPFHMISDEEMCDAFLDPDNSSSDYFHVNYPCLDPKLQDDYDALIQAIRTNIDKCKASLGSEFVLPDWIYSYMLGAVISVNSSDMDIYDLISLVGLPTNDIAFDADLSISCLKYSKLWIDRARIADPVDRPYSMFGEPHVIKCLRLNQVNMLAQ